MFDSIVLVSNRQPYRHEYAADDEDPDGPDPGTDGCGGVVSDGGTSELAGEPAEAVDGRSVTVERPTGGLTAGLDPVLREVGGTWVAWGDGEADRAAADDRGRVQVPPEDPAYTLQRVWLDEPEVDAYYRGYSNRVLWPTCHGLPLLIEDRDGDFDGYRRVNRRFADAAIEHAGPDTLVWLQDYHLALAPESIANATPPTTTVGQFWHVPWPTPSILARCPHGRRILEGLLGNDLLGFHVDRYAQRFLGCVDRFLPDADVNYETGVVRRGERRTRVTATPLGVDAERHDRQSRSVDPGVFDSLEDALDLGGVGALALGVDRLDYSKGIPERIAAVERFLERWPSWRGEFTFVQTASPSRTEIPAYEALGDRVRRAVDRVNDRFATDDWRPIVYTEAHLSREELCALYRRADLMLVTPLCDGMNLVAQEYVAASADGAGALCLSRDAGAHDVFGEHAYSIDPRRPDDVAETIRSALTAPSSERRRRMTELRRDVFERDLNWWMGRQFDDLTLTRRPDPATLPGRAGSGDRK
ncbi:trehalose-6-phosphate synthase [Halovivax sp.]|uniref:alpha,alpha-trehalose-phosphate synthase (UDP-forming) n=1 Tax=Halovivax sp. TaxID=1935978 RepID=UPI0025B99220|nr:trehalose-6-phosphate synthase [Halovivax sp.]